MNEGAPQFNVSPPSGSGDGDAQVFLSREGKKTSERDAGGGIIRPYGKPIPSSCIVSAWESDLLETCGLLKAPGRENCGAVVPLIVFDNERITRESGGGGSGVAWSGRKVGKDFSVHNN